MTGDRIAEIFAYSLLILLPLAALIARRPPLGRTVISIGAWVGIFAIGLLIVGERDRFPALLSEQSIEGRETRIRMSADGHFWADATIDGVSRRMLIDSGATTTAISLATAEAANLDMEGSPFPVVLNTANGQVTARTATAERLMVGNVTARDLNVVVSSAFGDTDVIGMNFLSRLASWRVEGRSLVLSPKPPLDEPLQSVHNVCYRTYFGRQGAMMRVPSALDRLVAIMSRLRDPVSGCAWDRAQTWATIAPYTIEEAYEVADAADRGDVGDLKDELGDLLLQVVFHSRIAEESGAFTLDDVATAIADKMERRHPHIFAGACETPGWEAIKAAERDRKAQDGALSGVAIGLPALLRAEKLQKRAARVGFDWTDADGPRAKIDEELAEVASADGDAVAEEIGDLLFATVNWARHLGVDAEAALRAGNAKFERRFAAMEELGGSRFASMSLSEQEALWQEVKRRGG